MFVLWVFYDMDLASKSDEGGIRQTETHRDPVMEEEDYGAGDRADGTAAAADEDVDEEDLDDAATLQARIAAAKERAEEPLGGSEDELSESDGDGDEQNGEKKGAKPKKPKSKSAAAGKRATESASKGRTAAAAAPAAKPTQEEVEARRDWLRAQMPLRVRPFVPEGHGVWGLWIDTSDDLAKNHFEFDSQVQTNPTDTLRRMLQKAGCDFDNNKLRGWAGLEGLARPTLDGESYWVKLEKILPPDFRSRGPRATEPKGKGSSGGKTGAGKPTAKRAREDDDAASTASSRNQENAPAKPKPKRRPTKKEAKVIASPDEDADRDMDAEMAEVIEFAREADTAPGRPPFEALPRYYLTLYSTQKMLYSLTEEQLCHVGKRVRGWVRHRVKREAKRAAKRASSSRDSDADDAESGSEAAA